MSYSIEPVIADQSLFEKFYGPTDGPLEYREWHNQTVDARIELANYERLYKQIPLNYRSTLTTEAEVDAQVLQDTTNDIGEAIKLMKSGKRVNQDQLEGIMAVQSSAYEALKITNDTLEALFRISFFSFMMNMQFRNIEQAARDAVPKIAELKKQLEKAKKKATQAKFQLAIDAALTVVQVLVPEITIITRVGIAVGQWGIDKMLGGEKSTATRDAVSDRATQAAIVQAGIQDNKWLSPGKNKIVTKAGTPLSVVGLYFDQDEVQATMDRVDVAKAAVKAAVESLRKVKALLERHRPAMVQFKLQMEHAARRMQDQWDTAKNIRWDRLSHMSDVGYQMLIRTKWKLVAERQPALAK